LKTSSLLVLALGLVLSSCQGQALPVVNLPVGSAVFRTEVALTPESRETGLMNRAELPENAAMLFVFPDEIPRVFWMKNTLVPLSIAYINKQGLIKEILPMAPLSLAPVASKYSAMYALEVNEGALGRQGVKVGDRLDLSVLTGLSEAR